MAVSILTRSPDMSVELSTQIPSVPLEVDGKSPLDVTVLVVV